mmetsp:Transcript_103843/g.178893  ORF Transcript_103843/g.178893 Transcript_103843/m.178893 type:complete len:835 (-) Transcript_103843:874-3378(-)
MSYFIHRGLALATSGTWKVCYWYGNPAVSVPRWMEIANIDIGGIIISPPPIDIDTGATGLAGAAEWVGNNAGVSVLIFILAGAGLVLCCILCVWFFRRRQRKKKEELDIVWIDPMLAGPGPMSPVAVARPAKFTEFDDDVDYAPAPGKALDPSDIPIGLPGMMNDPLGGIDPIFSYDPVTKPPKTLDDDLDDDPELTWQYILPDSMGLSKKGKKLLDDDDDLGTKFADVTKPGLAGKKLGERTTMGDRSEAAGTRRSRWMEMHLHRATSQATSVQGKVYPEPGFPKPPRPSSVNPLSRRHPWLHRPSFLPQDDVNPLGGLVPPSGTMTMRIPSPGLPSRPPPDNLASKFGPPALPADATIPAAPAAGLGQPGMTQGSSALQMSQMYMDNTNFVRTFQRQWLADRAQRQSLSQTGRSQTSNEDETEPSQPPAGLRDTMTQPPLGLTQPASELPRQVRPNRASLAASVLASTVAATAANAPRIDRNRRIRKISQNVPPARDKSDTEGEAVEPPLALGLGSDADEELGSTTGSAPASAVLSRNTSMVSRSSRRPALQRTSITRTRRLTQSHSRPVSQQPSRDVSPPGSPISPGSSRAPSRGSTIVLGQPATDVASATGSDAGSPTRTSRRLRRSDVSSIRGTGATSEVRATSPTSIALFPSRPSSRGSRVTTPGSPRSLSRPVSRTPGANPLRPSAPATPSRQLTGTIPQVSRGASPTGSSRMSSRAASPSNPLMTGTLRDSRPHVRGSRRSSRAVGRAESPSNPLSGGPRSSDPPTSIRPVAIRSEREVREVREIQRTTRISRAGSPANPLRPTSRPSPDTPNPLAEFGRAPGDEL